VAALVSSACTRHGDGCALPAVNGYLSLVEVPFLG
jgi:hypothetical protein